MSSAVFIFSVYCTEAWPHSVLNLLPICSYIHFRVWFYFTWPCLFTPKIFCISTYLHTYSRTYMHTYWVRHTHIHAYIRTYVHTYIHTYIHTHTYTHIHTYIHTYYMYTHIYSTVSHIWISMIRLHWSLYFNHCILW